MTKRLLTAVDDSAAGRASPRPLAVTLGAFVEALMGLTDDVDEIVAVVDHVLRTRAVPLGHPSRSSLLGVASAALAPKSAHERETA
jgi:hypothetical protein